MTSPPHPGPPHPGPPTTLLVTITFNALKHGILEPFFDCIRAQADRDFALLVVDNASTDGTADYLRELDLPNLRLILNDENVGFGRACNQGIALARELGAEFITFINNDVEFGPDLVGGMARSIRETGATALSPLITPFDQPNHVWFVTGSFRWNRGIIPYHDRIWQPLARVPGERVRRTDFATGCCLMVRTAVFDPTTGSVPGFDDRFFVYWEDADLSMTFLERGLPVVVDTALTLRHKVSTSTGGSFSAFSVFHFTRGHLLFVRKHHGAAALAWVLPVSAAKMALNVARGRMRTREIGAWARGLAAGLRD